LSRRVFETVSAPDLQASASDLNSARPEGIGEFMSLS